MRLWVMTNEYEPYIIGGLGVVATNLTEALKEKDPKITVLTKAFVPEVEVTRDKHFQVVRFPRDSGYFNVPKQKFNSMKVRHWLKKSDIHIPDLIHVHSLEFMYLARYFQKEHKVPVVYTCHSLVTLERKSLLREMVAKRQQKLLRDADCIVVPSFWEREQLEQIYPFCGDKITVIENGVRVSASPPRPAEPYRLLYVGRLLRMKGIEELLDAVSVIAKEQRKVRLDIVGKGSSSYTKHLKIMAHRKGIASRVRWLGYRPPDEVHRMYASYGAVIVPSRQESFGLVALEALASGVPLVSTRSGGLAQFVNEEVAQIISRVDSDDIANAVRAMWKADELTRQRVMEGFRSAEHFAWSVIADRYRELFYNVIEGRGATTNADPMADGEHI